jgi:hypothetical protein
LNADRRPDIIKPCLLSPLENLRTGLIFLIRAFVSAASSAATVAWVNTEQSMSPRRKSRRSPRPSICRSMVLPPDTFIHIKTATASKRMIRGAVSFLKTVASFIIFGRCNAALFPSGSAPCVPKNGGGASDANVPASDEAACTQNPNCWICWFNPCLFRSCLNPIVATIFARHFQKVLKNFPEGSLNIMYAAGPAV